MDNAMSEVRLALAANPDMPQGLNLLALILTLSPPTLLGTLAWHLAWRWPGWD